MERQVLLSALFAGLLASNVSASETDIREFSLDAPAADLQRLELHARVGEVVMRGADTENVEIRVRLEPDEGWFGRSSALAERMESAELLHEVKGGMLRVTLDYDRSGLGDDDLEEHWEVRLPSRMAADVELNVGRAEISGMAGGLDAEVNVGELKIDVQRGDVVARVNVGELNVRSATSDPGEFDLETNIGDARLRIDGEEAGRDSGWLGRSVSHDAGGEDDVTATVNVGEVSVEIRR